MHAGAMQRAGDHGDAGSDTITTEAVAHAMLRLVADMPGQMGRLRAARIVGGYAVPTLDEQAPSRLAAYAVEVAWPIRASVALLDALIDGGLLTQTMGQRPTLVLTRAGHRALDALEGIVASAPAVAPAATTMSGCH